MMRKPKNIARRAIEVKGHYAQARRAGAAVLVHSMGKVGSTAIMSATTPLLEVPTFHTHTLTPGKIARLGLTQPANHLMESVAVRRLISIDCRMRIITLVRDPAARNISAFFQNIDFFRRGAGSVEELFSRFMTSYPHDLPSRWFDEEVMKHFGIDVLGEPFDPTVGYKVFRRGQTELMVARMEDLDSVAAQIGDFLEIPQPLVIGRQNSASDKAYSHEYAQALSTFDLSEEYLSRCYDSRFAKHFYSPKELSSFRERWRR